MTRNIDRLPRPCAMGLPRAAVLFIVLVASAAIARAGDGPVVARTPATAPANASLAARVKHVLRGLGADEFPAREAATRKLEDLPADAVPLLEQALATGRLVPEVSARIDGRIALLRRKVKTSPLVKQQEQVADFVRDSLLRDYEQGGHTNPKWDDAARRALLLSIRPTTGRRWTSRDAARARDALLQVINTGCADPTVRYHEIRLRLELDQISAKDATDQLGPVVDELIAGKGCDWRKAEALVQRARVALTAGWPASAQVNARVDADINAAMKLFAFGVRGSDVPPSLRLSLAESFCDPGPIVNGWRDPEIYPKLLAVLKESRGKTNAPELFTAWHEIVQVPAARRVGTDSVNRRLAAAREALAKAYEIDPADPLAPSMMLSVIEAQRTRTDDMETWFARAVANNPGDFSAYQNKMFYLARFSTPEDVLAFAREVRAGGDWQDRLPLVLVDAHLKLGDFRASQRINEYLANDPQAWSELSEVYSEFLRRYPDATRDRSFFADLAARSGHWDVAAEQFRLLGDEAAVERFNGAADYAYLKRKAEAATRAAK